MRSRQEFGSRQEFCSELKAGIQMAQKAADATQTKIQSVEDQIASNTAAGQPVDDLDSQLQTLQQQLADEQGQVATSQDLYDEECSGSDSDQPSPQSPTDHP